jgi:hypothetical protein
VDGSVIISYNLSEKDYIVVNEDAKYVLPNEIWSYIYKFIAWFVTAILLVEFNPFKFPLLNILTVVILIIIFYSVDSIYRKIQLKRYFKKYNSILGNRVIEIDSNGVSLTANNDCKIYLPWRYILKVINSKNIIFISATFLYIYIPKRIFSNDEEVVNFVKLISKYIQ